MKLLAIDTATEACSAALCTDGEILDRYQLAPRRQAELILPMVDELLAESGIKLKQTDALVYGRGPGAFTGVRIAAGVVQGLAYGAGLPVIPVSTLAALAQGAVHQAPAMMSAIDARMGEIYWGCYRADADDVVTPVLADSLSSPADVQLPEDMHWFGVGSGWQTYHEDLTRQMPDRIIDFDGARYPSSRDMIPLAIREYNRGKLLTPAQAVPVYLRDRVTG